MEFQPGGPAALGGSGIRSRPEIDTPYSLPPTLTPYGHTGIADPLSLKLAAGAESDNETDLVIDSVYDAIREVGIICLCL